MKKKKYAPGKILSLIYVWLFFFVTSYGQHPADINPALLNGKWKAQWITCPGVSLKDAGVFRFRKTFGLPEQPDEFIIHVSGDNRYRLYVNGTEVCRGPARGDLAHWRYETVDIAGQLTKGKNIIAAVVWNYGEYRPLAQITNKTAFILQGNSSREEVVNTGDDWKVYKDESYKILPALRTSVGPGIEINGERYPYGWDHNSYDDENWETPRLLGNGIPRGKFTFWDWGLVPRSIPFLEYRLQRIREVERTENIQVSNLFPAGKAPVYVPENTKATILLDQTFLTVAYPEIVVSGGKGAMLELSYAEALVDKNGIKGNRNLTAGKKILSYYSDRFRPDGGKNRHFQPLWIRTYRYLKLTVETKDDPLTIQDIYGYFTAYPFQEKASFRSDDTTLQSIWDVGWRTARLCAGETYFDCPYYEQLQYIGDTRIQALISLYVSGDDRLVRKAIDQFYHSLRPMGLTQSRYPSCQPQVIPPFSLIWIGMIYDYRMLRDDREFIKKYLNGIRNVLYWYSRRINDRDMLGPLDWWNFIDWSFGPWNSELPIGGTPGGAMEGNSSIITLMYVRALQQAAELFKAYGYEYQSGEYRRLAERLSEGTRKLCWSEEKGLLADTPEKTIFSQHANILAILTGMFESSENKTLCQKILTDEEMIRTTFYFKFYLIEALKKAGLADDYFNLLGSWRQMINLGLTTFAETPEPTRSDCHAWSASPNYHFLSLVCGIRPASPGFKTVVIEPHPGPLKYIDASMPHPRGDITVKLKIKKGKSVAGTVMFPEGLAGIFKWHGKELELKSGPNKIKL